MEPGLAGAARTHDGRTARHRDAAPAQRSRARGHADHHPHRGSAGTALAEPGARRRVQRGAHLHPGADRERRHLGAPQRDLRWPDGRRTLAQHRYQPANGLSRPEPRAEGAGGGAARRDRRAAPGCRSRCIGFAGRNIHRALQMCKRAGGDRGGPSGGAQPSVRLLEMLEACRCRLCADRRRAGRQHLRCGTGRQARGRGRHAEDRTPPLQILRDAYGRQGGRSGSPFLRA